MNRRVPPAAAVLLALALAAPAGAAVLCQKRSGVVVVRETCKRKERPLELAQLGALGPKGDPGPAGPPGVGPLTTCPPDSVLVGPACVDKYEGSVWQIPAAATALIAKVKDGTATLADLSGGGAVQLSPSSSCTPAYPETFPATGNWTAPVYAASVAGALPSACITWFQAEQACRLSGKRLVTNQEWQAAAAGTPDPGGTPGSEDCNTSSGGPDTTGERTNCVSKWGTLDMVGNASEWVADWGDDGTGCVNWSSGFGGDLSCIGGNAAPALPGAVFRGGYWAEGAGAGVFAILAFTAPRDSDVNIGFRCAR